MSCPRIRTDGNSVCSATAKISMSYRSIGEPYVRTPIGRAQQLQNQHGTASGIFIFIKIVRRRRFPMRAASAYRPETTTTLFPSGNRRGRRISGAILTKICLSLSTLRVTSSAKTPMKPSENHRPRVRRIATMPSRAGAANASAITSVKSPALSGSFPERPTA